MSDQLISDGTYTVRGPGGNLAMDDSFPGVAVWRPEDTPGQHWEVSAASGSVILFNVKSRKYLGSDGAPDEEQMIVRGTNEPFIWKLSTGDDADEKTYVLTSAASSQGLVLSMSLLRIFPPLVAILSPESYSTVEWAFDAV